MKLYLPIIIIYLSLSLCSWRASSVYTGKFIQTIDIQTNKNTRLPILDTIIRISNFYTSVASSKPIDGKESEKILYDYFLKKGILSRKEWQIRSATNKGLETVDYDTIFEIHSAHLSGAVITYWLGPVDLNGHCFQPSKAIILNTKKGYRIENEGFIPQDFVIDSVKGTTIFGYEYECGGRGNLRHFKVSLR